ncbi:MAG TPA: hypothetical protein DCW89_02565, partial [Oceanospirillaceae bacterium]|nr:hypothetical protein [Oceanospirillaceae bacterium]
YYFAIDVDQDRIGKSPLINAGGYLRHLFIAVGSTVSGIRDNAAYASAFYFVRWPVLFIHLLRPSQGA